MLKGQRARTLGHFCSCLRPRGAYAQEMFVELNDSCLSSSPRFHVCPECRNLHKSQPAEDTVFESAFVLPASPQSFAEVQILPTGAKLSSRSRDGHASHAQSRSTRFLAEVCLLACLLAWIITDRIIDP